MECMKIENKAINEVIEQFMRIVNKYNALDNKSYDFGIDKLLTPAEIHTIDAIGKNTGTNVTQLAEKLGVTKGAVSQMISRLHGKGLVNKLKDSENEKEVVLMLTKQGKKAFDGHLKFHLNMYNDFTALLNEFRTEEFMHFKNVFDRLEYYLEQYGE